MPDGNAQCFWLTNSCIHKMIVQKIVYFFFCLACYTTRIVLQILGMSSQICNMIFFYLFIRMRYASSIEPSHGWRKLIIIYPSLRKMVKRSSDSIRYPLILSSFSRVISALHLLIYFISTISQQIIQLDSFILWGNGKYKGNNSLTKIQ